MKQGKENIREEQRKLFQVTREYKNERKRKLLTILGVLIVAIGAIKMFLGTIEIKGILPYVTDKSRVFDVTINGEHILSSCEIKNRVPIIPYLIYFDRSNTYFNQIYDDVPISYRTKSEKYILDVKSYSCHSKKSGTQVGCNRYRDKELEESDDIEYIGLKINNISVVYEGKFINDISKYIKDSGQYTVVITTKYDNIITDVSFDIEK